EKIQNKIELRNGKTIKSADEVFDEAARKTARKMLPNWPKKNPRPKEANIGRYPFVEEGLGDFGPRFVPNLLVTERDIRKILKRAVSVGYKDEFSLIAAIKKAGYYIDELEDLSQYDAKKILMTVLKKE
ncbi:hypothetical protein HY419_01450, partial [candidate division WWE3 bacterium]|nr:hypothetical protein [candidate division WWE3 bacterium]